MRILLAPFSKPMPQGNAKNYPYWEELIAALNGHDLIQIALPDEPKLVSDVRVGLSLAEIKGLLNNCDLFISVDSFLPHLAHTIGKSGIVLWGKSDPAIFGYHENINLVGDPSLFRADQFKWWMEEQPNPAAFVSAKTAAHYVRRFGDCSGTYIGEV